MAFAVGKGFTATDWEHLSWMDDGYRTSLLQLVHQTLEHHITGPWESHPDPINRTVHMYVAVRDQFYVEFQTGLLHQHLIEHATRPFNHLLRMEVCIRTRSNTPIWFRSSLGTDNRTDFIGWLSVVRNALDEWAESQPIQVTREAWWAQTEKKKGWL